MSDDEGNEAGSIACMVLRQCLRVETIPVMRERLMKIELDDKDWKLLEKHLGIYVEKNYLKLDPHFIDLYNQILEQHYASKVKELKK